ncbi:MAG: methyltransferase domain-containing protein [Cellvibrionaceae bacterium]
MQPPSDDKILESWHANAKAWTEAVRAKQIESRRLVTDRAILEAILFEPIQSAIDIGCGEGWLVRELYDRGIAATGIDAVPALVEAARQQGRGHYHCMSYGELAETGLAQAFDVAVCNFSLLGKESVSGLIDCIPSLLDAGGRCIVQTLNPNVERDTANYKDGWRPGSWDGFGSQFTDPAPWYFRTLETWLALFDHSGLDMVNIVEPTHPTTGLSSSIVFIAKLR